MSMCHNVIGEGILNPSIPRAFSVRLKRFESDPGGVLSETGTQGASNAGLRI